jgi:type IV secretion system protein VirB10
VSGLPGDNPVGGSPAEVADTVAGERGATLANAARSMQSRASSVVAAGLMITLGLSALSWYYAHALGRQSHARQVAQTAATVRAQGEMPLPSLGHIAPPLTVTAAPPTADPAPAGDELPPDMPLEEARGHTPTRNSADAMSGAAAVADVDAADPRPKTPGEIALQRRLSGLVFAREAQSSTGPASAAPNAPQLTAAPGSQELERSDTGSEFARKPGERAAGSLAALLQPSLTPATQAGLLPSERLLLPKGAFIDCTLETAIDSTLPGMTTCITAADTFSADGKVVLLERGTKLVGETRGQVQQGQARVFVVWTQARTPAGVVVPLDSPGTDELGRSGLPGEVQRHFWERFGAALLISLVDGAVQAGVQSANRSGGAVIYTPSASTDVVTEVLKDTLQIPPTVVKRNGERIQVLVARDIDFRSVYELHAAAAGR